MSDSQRWKTLQEAADYCRCSTVLIGREARVGRLRGYKLARRREWRFTQGDLDAWLMSSLEPQPFVLPAKSSRARTARNA